MLLSKWNYKKHQYEAFESPAVNPVLYEEDLETIKDCANCGKEKKFADMFTSKTIHTNIGFGYCVCEDCYQEEIKNEKEAENDETNN